MLSEQTDIFYEIYDKNDKRISRVNFNSEVDDILNNLLYSGYEGDVKVVRVTEQRQYSYRTLVDGTKNR